MSPTPLDLGLFCLAFLCTSAFSAAFGMGGGMMTVGVLSTFLPPVALIPVQNVILLFNSAYRTFLYREHINWKLAWPFIAGLAVGSIIGATVYVHLPEDAIRVLMAITMLAFTWGPKRMGDMVADSTRLRLLVGGAHGFLSTLTGAGGILQATFTRMRLKRVQLIGTLGSILCSNNLFRAIIFTFIGISLKPYWMLIVLSIPIAVCGNWIGKTFGHKLPQKAFAIVFKTLITAFAARLIIGAML